jgi:hypothetical protein
LDCIEFSNMLLVVLFYLVLKGTYWLQQQGNCTPGYRGWTAL